MKVVPIGDKIVVKRVEAEEASPGGILLPDTARETPKQGRVLSVGDGRLLQDGSRAQHLVTEGDRVLFSSYAGRPRSRWTVRSFSSWARMKSWRSSPSHPDSGYNG